MKKLLILATLALVAGLMALGGGPAQAVVTVHCVPNAAIDGSCDDGHATIQAAVDDAVTGDTVLVGNGTYTEAVSITGKGVTIRGESESGVIVQAAAAQTGAANTFTIDAAGFDVTIEYMTIRHGDYGIRSYDGNTNVRHTTVYHNGWDGQGYVGVPTQASAAADYAAYATSGGGIRIQNSGSSEIAYNTVYENDRGIRYQGSDNGNIHDNVSHDNIQAGIYLACCSTAGAPPVAGTVNTVVHNNESYDNMNNGILSIEGKNNTIRDNNVHDNWNTGVMLWFVAEHTIQGNTIDHNNLYAFNGQGNSGDALGGGIALDGDQAVSPSNFVAKIDCNTISNNQIGRAAQTEGVRIDTPSPADGISITRNTLTNHDMDIHILDEALTTTIGSNNFDGAGIGVQNDDASTVDAENNWWGAADGPSGNGPGSGDAVSANVDFTPWLLGPPSSCSVGGIVDLRSALSDETGTSYAIALASVIAAAAIALAAGAWYARKRLVQ